MGNSVIILWIITKRCNKVAQIKNGISYNLYIDLCYFSVARLFIASFLKPMTWSLYVGSVLVGLGAGGRAICTFFLLCFYIIYNIGVVILQFEDLIYTAFVLSLFKNKLTYICYF